VTARKSELKRLEKGNEQTAERAMALVPNAAARSNPVPPPTSSFAFTARCKLLNEPGMLGRLTSRIGNAGGDIREISIVDVDRGWIVRDITVLARDFQHMGDILENMRSIEAVKLLDWSDRTFHIHAGGKISVVSKSPLKTRDDLSMAYTPGVARISRAIAERPERARGLTIKGNCVAVVTDGSAILGLGNLGPQAALPVMEGKAMLFKEFAGVDAFPICLATQDVDEIVQTVENIAPVFGGVNLEDISAPRCFEIEERLQRSLDIPVFHDDQHGTAVVVLAALLNALRIVGKHLDELRVVVCGVGAAGMACTNILLAAGVAQIIGVDRMGAIHRKQGRFRNKMERSYAERTNPEQLKGSISEVIGGADVFLGVSAPPGVLTPEDVSRMAPEPIVFSLANPEPEIRPELIDEIARVVATGRSDYPNQINNVLCFPGLFRGLLDSGAKEVTDGMKVAAARAIADIIRPEELRPDYIIPSVFDRAVAPAVANAVAGEARTAGLARFFGDEKGSLL
jgi:malate dehydrogenase (oxaloacetate-decarboxylating)